MPHIPRFDCEAEAEACKFVQRGFYVEPSARPIDISTIPMNGTEYIHLQRLLDSNLAFDTPTNETLKPSDELMHDRKETAKEFRKFTAMLKQNKAYLKAKFPSQKEPLRTEKQWCAFCLGFDMYSVIFNSVVGGSDTEPHPPLLSIVLHLDQTEIVLLLKYHYQWFKKVGMIDAIGEWIYALLACLENARYKEPREILKCFYGDFNSYLERCDTSEKRQVNLILGILENFFKVKYLA